MKTRVNNKQFKHTEDTALIGIEWKSGGKGMLLTSKEGIVCLNNNGMDVRKSFVAPTKSDYLTRKSVKRGQGKVYVFENLQSLLKWFAKKK